MIGAYIVSIALGALPFRCHFLLRFFFSFCSVDPSDASLRDFGGILVRKIEGDYNNIVGFPAASFFQAFGYVGRGRS